MKTRRRLVLTAAIVGTFLAALDATVVGTAMPSVVGQLGGLALYPWVFSVYLLTSTITVPLYGKCADLFGRKLVYVVAVAAFVVGSVLCATSDTMLQLVLWRAVQGIGAGGVAPVTFTIVGDLYPPARRARIQGLFSAVWAVSSIAGPAVGALIVQYWSWQWIFLLNVPFGAAAAMLMTLSLHERVAYKSHKFDLLGAVLLMSATTLCMWGMLHGGRVGFGSTWVWASLVTGPLFLLLFVLQERRHPEPMIPPALVRDPVIAVTCSAGLFAGAVLFGVTSYIPAFVQGVLGGAPTDAGAAVIPIGIGWPLASVMCGWAIPTLGYRRTALTGGALLAVAAVGLLGLTTTTPRWMIFLDMGVIGLGMGFSMSALLIAAQEAVPWQRRGAATALVQFSRTIGGAISVAALGALLTGTLREAFDGQPGLFELSNDVMNPHKRSMLSQEAVAPVRAALGVGLMRVLSGVGVCGILACLATLAYPRRARVDNPSEQPPGPGEGKRTERTVRDSA